MADKDEAKEAQQ